MPTTPHTSARVNSNGASSGRSTRSRAAGPWRASIATSAERSSSTAPSRARAGEPVAVSVDPRGVDHEQQVIVVDPVRDEVVDGTAVLVEEQRVLRLAHADPAQVVREHRLEIVERRRAAHLELAHVAHVEDAGMLAHRAVLGDHAFVLHGHLPTRKRNHPGPGCQVPVVKRSAAEGLGRVHPEAQSIHGFTGRSTLRHRRRVNRRGASSNPSARYAAPQAPGASADQR